MSKRTRPLSSRIPVRWRWRIADELNRLPGICWAGLVDWALNEDRGQHTLRQARSWDCATDEILTNCGSCYCGKRRTPETDAQMRADFGVTGVVMVPKQRGGQS